MKWRYLSWLLPLGFFIDVPIAELFNQCPHIYKSIARTFSFIISPKWLFIGSCLLTLILYLKNHAFKKRALETTCFISLGFGIIRLLKNTVGRSRPKMWLVHKIHTCQFFTLDSHYCSFPSSHAFTAFFFAFLLAKRFPKYKIGIFAFATLLSVSRIIMRQHYFTDIAAGGCIAWAMSYFMEKKEIGQATPTR